MTHKMNYREKCLNEKAEQCVVCDETENVIVHHKDGDRENHDIDNLVPLCRSCHTKAHMGEDVSGKLESLQDAIDPSNDNGMTTIKYSADGRSAIKAAQDRLEDETGIRPNQGEAVVIACERLAEGGWA